MPRGSADRRRSATPEEARALANPIRLRILRLCKDESLTNKELAVRLELHPATALHHVRTLVATGFLREAGRRPGPRGTVEKPYRSTGKSWRVEVEDEPGRQPMHWAVLEAVGAEIEEGGRGAVIELTRMAMRLGPERLAELHERLEALAEEYAFVEEAQGEPVAMLLVLHRRSV